MRPHSREQAFGEDEASEATEVLQRLHGFCYGAVDVFDEANV